jgi:hypothetical protein
MKRRQHLDANQMLSRFNRSAIPTSPNQLLTRKQTAEALTESGFKTAPTSLATKVSRGGGPPHQLYGKTALFVGAILSIGRIRD